MARRPLASASFTIDLVLCLYGEPYRRIDLAVTVVTPASLHNFEEESPAEKIGVGMEEFTAIDVRVVKHVSLGKAFDQRW
jgi:hypothetical protein